VTAGYSRVASLYHPAAARRFANAARRPAGFTDGREFIGATKRRVAGCPINRALLTRSKAMTPVSRF